MTDLPEDIFDEADAKVFARLATALQATEISEAQHCACVFEFASSLPRSRPLER